MPPALPVVTDLPGLLMLIQKAQLQNLRFGLV